MMYMTADRDFISGMERLAPTGVLLHSDLLKGWPIEFGKGQREKALNDHYRALSEFFKGLPMYFPTFHYRWFTEKHYDVAQAPSEVGMLSEYVRRNIADWRTKDPVFSYCGKGKMEYPDPVKEDALIDPFGSRSFFQYAYDQRMLLFHYGSELRHSTLIHYIERKLGVVPYRYDKYFAGRVRDGDREFAIRYLFHARPRGRHLEYDWDRIGLDLSRAGILHSYEEGRTMLTYCGVREMTDFIFPKLKENPYYMLDAESTAWLRPAVQQAGGALRLEDFE